MLNEYEKQKQEEFDILCLKELDNIDYEIIKVFIDTLNSITDKENFIQSLFNHEETYSFKLDKRKIEVYSDCDTYMIDIDNDITQHNDSICDMFHIYDSNDITYEHHDVNKEVYWNDEMTNFKTNKEKIQYFKEKINFLYWFKRNVTDLIHMIMQGIEYYESDNPIMKDVESLNKLAKEYLEKIKE